jgi:hypothetical protein
MISMLTCYHCGRAWEADEIETNTTVRDGVAEVRCAGCGALHEYKLKRGPNVEDLRFTVDVVVPDEAI